MNPILRSLRHALLGTALLAPVAFAQDAVPSARDLAAQLSQSLQDGQSVVRLKMEITKPGGEGKTVLQIQVKSKRTKDITDLVYQVLWPKERKGESFLLQKSGSRPPTGMLFTPPNSMVPLTPEKMKDGIFGSDLSFEDLVENFFAWESQAIVGTESLGGAKCQILESKPGKGDRASGSKVRSWIDTKRMVTLRVEKFSESGKLAKRIDTTRVSKDDTGRSVASSFSLQRSEKSVTTIEGSNIKHGVIFSASYFVPESLRTIRPIK